MNEEELLKKYGCNSLGIFIDQYLTCDVAYELLRSQFKEIERLNNIINEFDKWLDKESEKENYSVGHLTCLMMSKVKLQELKEMIRSE